MELNKNDILLVGLAVAALAYAYNKGVFSDAGQRGYNIDPTKAENVPDGSTVSAGMSDAKAKNLARSFRGAMLDNSYSGQIFQDACNSLLGLSDADLIAVSNAYNGLYINDTYKTLRAVLQQEYVYYSRSQKLRAELLRRFDNLGI